MKPLDPPANGAPAEATHQEELTAENQRLRASLEETEQRLREAEDKRDFYRHFALLWMMEPHAEADWVDFNPEEYTPLKREMMDEARKLLNW